MRHRVCRPLRRSHRFRLSSLGNRGRSMRLHDKGHLGSTPQSGSHTRILRHREAPVGRGAHLYACPSRRSGAWRLRQLCDLPPGHRRIRGGQRHHAWIGGVGRRVPWRICAGSPSQGPAQPWRSLLHRDHIHRPSCLYGVRDLRYRLDDPDQCRSDTSGQHRRRSRQCIWRALERLHEPSAGPWPPDCHCARGLGSTGMEDAVDIHLGPNARGSARSFCV
mmetsp:Transcript_12598/g.38513  ORF Transcript_12598/g.38513 Transcript_12598/m.38513 type:complete len:220 (+) Transcript_12598:205-864(+)